MNIACTYVYIRHTYVLVNTYIHVTEKKLIKPDHQRSSQTKEEPTRQDKFDEVIRRQRRNRAVATRKVAQESFRPVEEMQDGKS